MDYSAFRPIERASRKSAVNACSDRLYCIYLPFQKIMTQRNIVALEVRGVCLYVFFVCLFVAL